MPFSYSISDPGFVPYEKADFDFRHLSDEERKGELERMERLGFVAPRKDGVLTEWWQGLAGAALGVGKGVGSTLEETTGYGGMKEYFGNVMLRNQQYNPHPGYKAMSLNLANIARTIGSGTAQSGLSIAGGIAATALSGGNPAAGFWAGTSIMFGQIYGDRVQEYREAMPNEDESTVKGLAFLSAFGESLIETKFGPEALMNGIAKKLATGALKETTQSLVKQVGKEAAKNFITEGAEEVAQDYWDRLIRSAAQEGVELPSWEEVGETFMGGAWSGLALGAAGGAFENVASRGKNLDRVPISEIPDKPGGTPDKGGVVTTEPEKDTTLTASVRLAAAVGKQLGIDVHFFDEPGAPSQTVNENGDRADAWYDEATNQIWLDRVAPENSIMALLGHEFKHYLDKNHGSLVEHFNELVQSGLNEAGREAVAAAEKQYEEAGQGKGHGLVEIGADEFGRMWQDPDFWQDVATRAEKMEAGLGQKFMDALQEFLTMIRKELKKIGTPEAKQLFDNLGELREEAVKITAEIKRQAGTSTEEENVVGVNGSTTVESVPVSEINLDPERFQFKSNTNNKTGVDESNQLGGEWDPKSAGIIYVWEDKDGNKFVVNGHHRLDLAKRKNVKEMNAIVDREADGVTAEQARRNGVLINIRDEQGEIRDYADFVRTEKLDESTAEKEGVLSRRKGRAGFAIGHYASDNLYATYRNRDITDSAAAAIAEVAQGDTGVENAGIKAAKGGMKRAQLVEHLKFLKMIPREGRGETEQGDLFGGFDDSVLKMSEDMSAKALKHIDELKEQINAAKAAVKNPDAAKKLGVSVGKEAQKLLDKTRKQLQEWENWQTNQKLFQQLVREAGYEKEFNEVIAERNAEAKPEEKPVETNNEGRFNPNSETPLLTPEEDANDFTLIDQTPEEAKSDEQAAERREEAARERADQQSKRETPDLNFLDEHIVVSGAPITGTQVAEKLTEKTEKTESVKPDDAKIEAELRNVIAQPIPDNLKLARLKRLAKTWGIDYNNLKKRYDALANPVENAGNGDILSKPTEEQGASNDNNAGNETGSSGQRGSNGASVEHGGLQERPAAGSDSERANPEVSPERDASLPRPESKSGGTGTNGESSSGRGAGSELHAPDRDRPGNGTVRVDGTRSTDSERVVEEGVPGREESAGTGRGRTTGEAGSRAGDERSGNADESAGHLLNEEPSDPNKKNHRIGKDDELIVGGDKAKVRANIAAIKLLKKLEAENREATPDEKKVLAKYVGWGGLKNVFSRYHSDYSPELRQLLTDEEYDAAAMSILNAHYTDRAVIEKMWKLAEHLGFKGGKVGEFGAGVGHFLGLVPDNLVNKTKFRAVELDSITGRILKKLYPEADVTVAGLQDTRIPNNSLSLVIGNVPFSEIKIFDKKYPESLALHNYFIARSLDAVKPGGLVVTISTHGTLDAMGTTARKRFAEKADFLGAIRLPSNAFQKNAGTDVVTDILVFRKKDGTASNSENFIQTVDFEYDGEKVALNEYFSEHPDMMLGTPSIGHGMYANNSFLLEADKTANLSSQIDIAMKKIYEAHKPEKDIDATIHEELPTNTEKSNLKDGELYIEDGKLYEWHKDSEGTPNPVLVQQNSEAANKKAVARVAGFQELKHAHNALINAMENDCSDAQLKALQGLLKKAYDQFVKKFGNIADARAQKVLKNDPTYFRASGLEKVDSYRDKDGKEKYSYSPADIFTKRTIVVQKEPTHASSAKEAADISMKFHGHLDPDYMETLTGRDFDTIKKELTENGDYFENPENGLLEVKEDYLSGNIKEKLERAKEEAKSNPDFEKNVEALKNAMPPRKGINEFQFRLGARWIPVDLIKKWCAAELGATRLNITYNKAADIYTISGNFTTREFDAYGYSAEDILQSALSLKKLEVWEHLKDGKRRLDHEATQAVEELQKRMIARFHDYVTGNADATKAIEDAYNSDVNVFVSREMSNTETDSVYPGAADSVNGKPIRLRSYQRNAVSRMMRQNTLLAHCVGAGKTYTMITAAMELVRTKMAKKPLIVVQNATIRQFGTSASSLYPTARILCVDKDDFTKENRQRTISKIVNNEWDLIILPQSQFNRLDVTPESKAAYYQGFIDQLREALADEEDRLSQREIQRKIAAFEEKLKKIQAKATKKDEAFYFNELGVDAIFMDEAHAYKKPFFVTNMKRIKGLNTETSERSIDLSIKLDEIKKKTGGRNIFFATGTPVTNTLAEVWHMVRYLTPEGKMPYGCETFDQFASMFCEVENVTEPNAAGQYQSINRFSKFTNLQELSIFFRSVADVVLPEDLKNEVKRPPLKNGKPTEIIIEKSPYMDSFMRFLGDLYLWYNHLSGSAKKDAGPIPLIANTYAAKATADMRLVRPALPEDPDSKISRCAVEVKKRYDETSDVRGAQCVFLDLFRHTNSATKKVDFNAYDELKRKLVELGIPENEIAGIDKVKNDEDKKKLFEDVNAGRVRVIVGGTETLGTGVNIQERLVAVHHLDATYMPSGMEQRNGRILRQGNTIPEVEILQYAIRGTLDEVKYQLLARKKSFIDSVLRGDAIGEFEDDDTQNFDYEKFSAMISGNKDAMRYVTAKDELNKVKNSYQLYLYQKSEAQQELQRLKDTGIPGAEKLVRDYENDKKILSKFDFDNIVVTTDGKSKTTNRKLFAEFLDNRIKTGKAQEFTINLSGIECNFEVNIPSGMAAQDDLAIGTAETFNRYTMKNFRGRSAEFKSGAGFMQSLSAFIGGADKRIADAKTELDLRKQQIPALEEALKRTFPDLDRMNTLEAEVSELKTKLTTNEEREILVRPQIDDYFDVGGVDIISGENVFAELGSTEENTESAPEVSEGNTRHYKLVTDKKLIQKLDSEDYITTYRAAQVVDGKLYPPMAAKVNGDWGPEIQLGKWEQADERPELARPLIDKKTGKQKTYGKKTDEGYGNPAYQFVLNKGNKKSVSAAYNPYIHSSLTPLNDQFTEAYQRPNLVVLEIRVPKSELTSGYHAEKAKNSVGMKKWKAGTVQGELSGTRKVMLSRWDKPVRIVPDSEVAKIIKAMLAGKNIPIPYNVVTPSLRSELEKIGVPIEKGVDYKLKTRQQVNPIREDGEIKDSYQGILDNSVFESKSKKVLNTQATRMLAGFGGIPGTIEAIRKGDFKPTSDAAQRALQIVLNSDEFKKLPEDERAKIADAYIKSGTEAGRTLAARRLGVLDWSDIISIQAHVNSLIAKFGKENANRLRDDIQKELGIDIDNLPDDIVNNPRELDKVLRKLISARANWTDKAYEYWINAILSSPTTHVANTIGNVTNAVYELGVKRLAEATINAFMRRKDAATFGEFKEMTRAIDWKDAWERARFMFDVETMNTQSKLEMAHTAIGGKLGRAIRVPGRLLRAADEFAKAVVVPIEAAAFAYRQGVRYGYSGEVLQSFIADQLKNEKSKANEWGRMRSLELTFQEQNKPGSVVNYLIQLREAGGVSGTIMKYVLPFIKTPHNILKQGVRKSPLGVVNLAWQTVQGVRGKREFDSEYVSLAAEQLLAWGVVMALAGGDDDDKPLITGSSPRYGSAEQKFKENKLPPYSIRIGKNYYSYQRIEPLSTGLALIADGIAAYKAAKRGESGQKIMRDLLGKTGRMVREKSFLDSINTIGKVIDDPEQSGMKILTNFAASWSPNVVRHTINMFDDNVRDNRARERGKKWFEDQFYVTMNAAGFVKASPKYDYFGRPVKKDSLADSGPLWQMMRLVPIKSVSPDDNMNRAEKLMWKYNMTHPGAEYYPDVPAYYFQRDGKKLYMTGKYWDEFAQKSGQLALKQINNAFKHGLLNERKPTEKDIDLIKKIFQRARKEVRDEMYEKKHYQK